MHPPLADKNTHCLLLMTLLLCAACGERAALPIASEIHGITMGTRYSIHINAPELPRDKHALHQAINTLLAALNHTLSTYIEDSELMQLNNNVSRDWVRLSPALYTVIETAQHISRLSHGSFDITVGPMINLWGFGRQPQQQIPDQALLERIKPRAGYTLLELDQDRLAIRRGRADMFIDLSAIAKGYAVDRIAEWLDEQHIDNYLVEIGGEIRAKGRNHRGVAWQIGIEKPHSDSRAVQRVIRLENMAMATSGDYRNFFTFQGRRYSHAIDPKTAQPVNHNLVSVTVLHPSCMLADAFATAILIAGPTQGMQLAEQHNLSALLISTSADGFIERESSAWQQ